MVYTNTFLFRHAFLQRIMPKSLGFSHLRNLRFTSYLRFSGLVGIPNLSRGFLLYCFPRGSFLTS